MVFTRPVEGSEVSATNFGQPVYDALNANKVVAGVSANLAMSNIGNGVWVSVTGISFSFTPKANRAYQLVWWAVITGLAGQWVNSGVSINGATPARFSISGTLSSTAPTYGHNVGGLQIISKYTGGLVTPASTSFQLQVTGAGGAISIGSGAPCSIALIDLGPEV